MAKNHSKPSIKLIFKKYLSGVLIIWHLLDSRRIKQLIFLIILSLISASTEILTIGSLNPLLSAFVNPQQAIFSLGPLFGVLDQLPVQHLLLALTFAFVLVTALCAVLRIFNLFYQLKLVASITADLGKLVFSNSLRKNYNWHLENNSNKILSVLTTDVDQVSLSIQGLVTFIVNSIFVLGISGYLLINYSEVSLLLAFTYFLIYLMVFQFTRKSLKLDGVILTESYEKSLKSVNEAFGGIRDVILDESYSLFEDSYYRSSLRSRLARASITAKGQTPRFAIEGFTIIIAALLAAILTLNGQNIDSKLPQLGILLLGAFRILQPLQQCFGAVSRFQANHESLLRIKPFLRMENEGISEEAQSFVPSIVDKNMLLALKNVSFKYETSESLTLQDINLTIYSGETIAFVGNTGSGKSTCIDTILGLIEPCQGKVIVKGCNIFDSKKDLKNWQREIAHVPQQIFLSDSSFVNNIAFGVPDKSINHDLVVQAAKAACIDQFILSTPNGFSTLVGERGCKLSGGQRQRIGIARAFYKNAKLLVLDEATSALDNSTEKKIMKSLSLFKANLSIIMIAHRLSTVKDCDRIIVMNNGRIEAVGKFGELATSCKTFQELLSHSDLTYAP